MKREVWYDPERRRAVMIEEVDETGVRVREVFSGRRTSDRPPDWVPPTKRRSWTRVAESLEHMPDRSELPVWAWPIPGPTPLESKLYSAWIARISEARDEARDALNLVVPGGFAVWSLWGDENRAWALVRHGLVP